MKKIVIIILVILVVELAALGIVNFLNGEHEQCFLVEYTYPVPTDGYIEREVNPCFGNTLIFYSGIFNITRNCSTRTTEVWENKELLETNKDTSCQILYSFFDF